jgi:transposase
MLFGMARPLKKTVLSDADRVELQRRVESRASTQSEVWRAQVVLLSAEAHSIPEIQAATGLSRIAVHRWKSRYAASGLAGLEDAPRAGRPRELDAATTRKILKLTTERIPHESTHWSVRTMAKYADTTPWHVRSVWEAADLQPHRVKTFKLSNDPLFAEKVVDVVGLYIDPPAHAMVLSVDEKTQIQALDRTQPNLPLRPGKTATRTHDDTRHGTASLYAAFDILTGRVMGRVTKKHRAREFLDFLRQIHRSTDVALDVHLILDNSSTHKTAEVERWRSRNPRFHFHFTPTSASWLNAVEGWFGQLERRSVRRGTFGSVQALRNELRRYIAAHNAHSAKPFRWTKSADSIIAAVDESRAAIISI